ncbi:hypothetical protein HRbin16_02896 [bacterium HR16]|nr:hypothetical protein HRbin16_02896 [bacterium HR16]
MVGWVEAHLFHRLSEEILRVAHQVLVQRVVLRHEDNHRFPVAPPRPARLLPCAGDTAGVACHHHHIQSTDVHPQFQRVGADYTQQFTVEKPAFDLAPLLRRVARTIRHQSFLQLGGAPFRQLVSIAQYQLGGHARFGENQRAPARFRQRGHDGSALHIGAQSLKALADNGWIPQYKIALRTRRTVLLNQRAGQSRERLRRLLRVADCGGGEDKLRTCPVKLRQPTQPAQHQRHMRAKHATIGVHFIHYHIPQFAQETRPGGVVGQDTHMQHVGIG